MKSADGSTDRLLTAVSPEEQETLAAALVALGCPEGQAAEMARQLDRRAAQLARQKGRSHTEAMAHLLGLMKRGWAAPPAAE